VSGLRCCSPRDVARVRIVSTSAPRGHTRARSPISKHAAGTLQCRRARQLATAAAAAAAVYECHIVGFVRLIGEPNPSESPVAKIEAGSGRRRRSRSGTPAVVLTKLEVNSASLRDGQASRAYCSGDAFSSAESGDMVCQSAALAREYRRQGLMADNFSAEDLANFRSNGTAIEIQPHPRSIPRASPSPTSRTNGRNLPNASGSFSPAAFSSGANGVPISKCVTIHVACIRRACGPKPP
jgi:hypothetical protein